jgi:phenylpyruvate tautomerase PptA (4-oxalocrotonate tautomerase family)
MPYVLIQTNLDIPSAKQQEVMQRFSQTLSAELGKPEVYVMVALQPKTPMLFAGKADPAAYLELKSISLPNNLIASLSETLCNLMEELLEVPPSRVYIEFSSVQSKMWGWDGATF